MFALSPRIGLTLDTILRAATEIADERSVQDITLSALAQKLEVRSPSLYNHIDGLPGLHREMAVLGLTQLKEALMHAAVGRSGDTAIHEISRAYLQFARSHPGWYEATFYTPEQPDERLDRLKDEVLQLVTRVLQGFGLEEESLIHVTRGLRSVLHGFSSLERSGGFGLLVDIDESFEMAIRTFLTGLHTFQNSKTL
ncbi:TetR/AcrR family transcriptional regulator [Paenibacillus sp. Z6-24]